MLVPIHFSLHSESRKKKIEIQEQNIIDYVQ